MSTMICLALCLMVCIKAAPMSDGLIGVINRWVRQEQVIQRLVDRTKRKEMVGHRAEPAVVLPTKKESAGPCNPILTWKSDSATAKNSLKHGKFTGDHGWWRWHWRWAVFVRRAWYCSLPSALILLWSNSTGATRDKEWPKKDSKNPQSSFLEWMSFCH